MGECYNEAAFHSSVSSDLRQLRLFFFLQTLLGTGEVYTSLHKFPFTFENFSNRKIKSILKKYVQESGVGVN
jgi:hypothetical protein